MQDNKISLVLERVLVFFNIIFVIYSALTSLKISSYLGLVNTSQLQSLYGFVKWDLILSLALLLGGFFLLFAKSQKILKISLWLLGIGGILSLPVGLLSTFSLVNVRSKLQGKAMGRRKLILSLLIIILLIGVQMFSNWYSIKQHNQERFDVITEDINGYLQKNSSQYNFSTEDTRFLLNTFVEVSKDKTKYLSDTNPFNLDTAKMLEFINLKAGEKKYTEAQLIGFMQAIHYIGVQSGITK